MTTGKSLTAKTLRPRFARTHRRDDLLRLLDALTMSPLVIISGLVGAGKTSLVSGYAESRNLPCLWYQMDRSDECLSSFFHYMGAAVANAQSCEENELPLPSPECIAGVSAHVKEYFRKLYQNLGQPFLVVFNDYQALETGWPLHQVIKEACEVIPAEGRVIIIASNDNPPTVTWMRTDNSAFIVGWQELRLRPNMLDDIMAVNGNTLPAGEDAKRLRHKVGDWAAELILSMQSSFGGEVK